MVHEFIERNPHVGILASLSGIGVSVVGWLHYFNIILETGGAAFGLLAGFYTFRIKLHHWRREKTKGKHSYENDNT